MRTVYASSVATLDSDVYHGGGTDVTDALQSVLDGGNVHLIVDGAALVHGLVIYSNTVIECPTASCGFFMDDYHFGPILRNANQVMSWDIIDHDMILLGGTYNHNCMNQLGEGANEQFLFNTEFLFNGTYNLTMKDVHIRNFRAMAMLARWMVNTVFEGLRLELPDFIFSGHQDGFNIGFCRNLIIRDFQGTSGDDILSLGGENTDVLIDGVFFHDARQGIRMLNNGKSGSGPIDRVTVRNVTGNFHTFVFSVNAWYPNGNYGNFGSLDFENIDVRMLPPLHDFTPQMFCWFGGDIDSVTFRNVRVTNTTDHRPYFELGVPYMETFLPLPEHKPRFKYFELNGFTVIENSPNSGTEYVNLHEKIDHVVLRDIHVFREGTPYGSLVTLPFEGACDTLSMSDVHVKGLENTIYAEKGHSIERLIASNVILENIPNGLVNAPNDTVKKQILHNVNEL